MADSLRQWLDLREAADHAARSAALARTIAGRVEHQVPLRIVDLGSGTGSNVRYLTRRLPHPQHWLLVDRDPALLEDARRSTPEGAVIETRELNLGATGSLGVIADRDLVTASALLDLVSASWVRTLAERCRASGAAVLLALTYDGRSRCWPPEPEDDDIRTLMNQHQKCSNNGFGIAAGPDATACAERAFLAAGYQVQCERSDWVLRSEGGELQRRLIEGWTAAAAEVAPERVSAIEDWSTRRLAHVDAGRSRITVGHQDLIAWFPR